MPLHTRKLVGATALALVGLAATASHASAAVFDQDKVLVNSDHVDFGKLARAFGQPVAGGDVVFSLNGGVVTASVTGRTHGIDIAGTCARVHLEFLDAAGAEIPGLDRFGDTVCSTEDGVVRSDVWTRSASNPDIELVKVITELRNTNGVFVPTASKTTRADDI